MNEQNLNEVILFKDDSSTIFKVPFSDTVKEVQAQPAQITLNDRFKLRLIRDVNHFNNQLRNTKEKLDFKFKTADGMWLYSWSSNMSAYHKGPN